jgi:hypothetical protein
MESLDQSSKRKWIYQTKCRTNQLGTAGDDELVQSVQITREVPGEDKIK